MTPQPTPPRTLGIVGGIGPESTIQYYRLAISEYRARRPDGSAPPVVINSIDVSYMLGLVAAGDLAALTAYLVRAVRVLAAAEADFGLLAANTPHLVFDAIQRQSSLPLISIVEATCAATTKLGLRRVGLFGTSFTMQSTFFADVFAARGIAVVAPSVDEQTCIHGKYTSELLDGKVLDETRQAMLEIAARMRSRDRVEAIVLAGTELSPLLAGSSRDDFPFLDTTRIHASAAIARMLGQDEPQSAGQAG